MDLEGQNNSSQLHGNIQLLDTEASGQGISSEQYKVRDNTQTLDEPVMETIAGAAVVTLNAKLLGGKISCFQSVCVLGYCIFPINISAFICVFIGSALFFIRLSLVVLSFIWSTMASTGFMAALVSDNKRILAVYPVFLFYLFLSWYCLIVE